MCCICIDEIINGLVPYSKYKTIQSNPAIEKQYNEEYSRTDIKILELATENYKLKPSIKKNLN